MGRKRSVHRHAADQATFAYEGLDRVLHEKARLGILTALLAQKDGLLFTDLKALCDLTDGNLSRHLAVLEEAHIVETSKNEEEKRPRTNLRLTRNGRTAFLAYLEELERVIQDARASVLRPEPERTRERPRLSLG